MADFTRHSSPSQEWTKFVDDGRLPPPPKGSTLIEIRENLNAAREKAQREFYGSHPDDVSIHQLTIPTLDGTSVQARLYRPKSVSAALPLYIHLHSGGWYVGTLDTEEPFCAFLCSAFYRRSKPGIAVLNVCYRHTPEHSYPTQLNDAYAALEYLFSPHLDAEKEYGVDRTRIVVGGTSAGASLSLGCTVREVKRLASCEDGNIQNRTSRIQGLLLTCPPTVNYNLFPHQLMRSREVQSYTQCASDPLLGYETMTRFWTLFLGCDSDASREMSKAAEISPLIAPDALFDKQYWPPTTFHVAGDDVLRDEALLLEEKLKRAGIPTRLHVRTGYPHAFNMIPNLQESTKWRETILDDLSRLIDPGGKHNTR